VLAALTLDPDGADPAEHRDRASERWNGVLDAMVGKGYLDRSARSRMTYPAVLAKAPRADAWQQGANGVLGHRIEQELQALGFTEQDVRTGGLQVRTTISRAAQDALVKAARAALRSAHDPDLASAAVSIDPKTGAVRAYYGGEQGYGRPDLAAAASGHPPAATFQPFVLAAAVDAGYGIDSLWDGTSGQVFENRADPLDNAGGDSSCGRRCSLTAATVKSVATVQWAVTTRLGPAAVVRRAQKAGLRTLDGARLDDETIRALGADVSLGRHAVSVLDQATAYATLAADGTRHAPYFVTQVADADGTILWEHASNTSGPERAWAASTGRNVSYVLQQSYAADAALDIGRPAAAKSGAQRYGDSSDAWTAGYTPDLATVVWVGAGDAARIPAGAKNNGTLDVRGSRLPGAIWRDYMRAALNGRPVTAFAPPDHEGKKAGNAR